MSQVLLIKMSSMGDIVHCFPALDDAAEQGLRFDWVVEEAFADLAAKHPAIDRVYPIALRRWRKRPLRSLAEFIGFLRTLREQPYERVLDAQGLLKSALVARGAQTSNRLGLAANSAREPIASRFYDQGFEIRWEQHAIDRLRLLFAAALDYEVDLNQQSATSLVLGDASAQSGAPAPVVLLQGTSWASKDYPAQGWQQLCIELAARGAATVQLISSNASEHDRARAIAQAVASQVPGFEAPAPEPLSRVVDRIAGAGLVIGVDSGLTHLAAALGVPTLGLYGPTSAELTGARGPKAHNIASGFDCAPCMQRQCSYQGAAQTIAGQVVTPACFAQWAASELLDAVAADWPPRS